MKKIVAFLIILLVSSPIKSQRGWFSQKAPDGIHSLNDISAISSEIAIAVGDSGRIIKTIDGGNNWKVIQLKDSTYPFFNSVFFIDSVTGWAVGRRGWYLKQPIYKTTDCGETWFDQPGDPTLYLYSVYFINKDTGWCAGLYGSILKTTNGGNYWTSKESGVPHNGLTDICFLNSKIGYATGWEAGWGDAEYGVLLTSTDGGETWENSHTGNLTAICFIDSSTGWILGNTELFFTNNGGSYWEAKTMDVYNMNSIVFVNKYKGWVAGSNTILNTIDGGNSWNNQVPALTGNNNLRSICFFNENVGWAVGYYGDYGYGIILKTLNGGITGLDDPKSTLPKTFSLSQNYPNPFNPTTTINYSIPKSSFVTIKVYDILGKEVATLVNENKKAGNYSVLFGTGSRQFASGVYLYRMTAGSFAETKKFVLMK